MSTAPIRRFNRLLVAMGGLGLCLACGGDDPAPVAQTEEPAAQPTAPAMDGVNSPPEILRARFEPARPTSGEPLKVVAEPHDADGDRVQLGFRWTLDGRPATGGGDRIELRGFEKGDVIEVEITPSDAETSGDPYVLRTRIENRPPVVHSVKIDAEGAVQAGADLRAVANARDHDRDGIELEYTWYANGRKVGEGEVFDTAGLARDASVTVEVTAFDGEDRSSPVESEPVTVGNTPPQIVSQPAAPGPDGVFRYQIRAEDPDGDRGLVFRIVHGPDGMSVDRTSGEVVWKPRADQVGTFPIALLADDRKGGLARQEFELTVAAPPASPTR
jgi:hypothetical protein